MLLDKPALGLSPKLAGEFLDHLHALRSEGLTIVLVEQKVQNALSVADRACVYDTGRIAANKSAEGLLGHPDILKAYLGAAE